MNKNLLFISCFSMLLPTQLQAEVNLIDLGVGDIRNYALAASVDQSSTYIFTGRLPNSKENSQGVHIGTLPLYAGLATDNRTDGSLTEKISVSHTQVEDNPWWRAKLKTASPVKTIRVWKRKEAYGCTDNNSSVDCSRLDNWSLFISHNDITDTGIQPMRSNPQIEEFAFNSYPTGDFEEITFPSTKNIKSVVIVAHGQDKVLNLAEVQLLGANSDTVPPVSQDLQTMFERKTGLFMHWGPGSYNNTEWNSDFNVDLVTVTPQEIEQNVSKWSEQLVHMGADYGMLIAKHHDGFSNFETAHSDYKITNTSQCKFLSDPSQCDVVAHYVREMREADLDVGLYFSILDRQFTKQPETFGYVHGDYIIKAQLKELLTKYGEIDILWFDALGWLINDTEDVNLDNLRRYIRQISPNTLVLNNDQRHSPISTDIDVYEIGAHAFSKISNVNPNSEEGSRPKEVTDTMAATGWFWKTYEAQKSLPELMRRSRILDSLANTAMLLNVAPNRELTFEKSALQRAHQREILRNSPELAGGNTIAGKVNLAYDKPTRQSSNYSQSEGLADSAVDGLRHGSWQVGSVSHTQSEDFPWWQVDLGSAQSFDSVRIFNRTDCCAYRLDKLVIAITDNDLSSTSLDTLKSNPNGATLISVDANGAQDISVPTPSANGRYVRIYLDGSGYLSLAEVEILTPNTALPVPGFMTQQSTTYNGDYTNFASWKAVDGITDYSALNGKLAHTDFQPEPWWLTDLGDVKTLSEIKIWNRGPERNCSGVDSCDERLRDYVIVISHDDIRHTPFSQITPSPRTWVIPVNAIAQWPSVIDLPRYLGGETPTGRYVRIIKPARDDGRLQELTLSEVEIYAQP